MLNENFEEALEGLLFAVGVILPCLLMEAAGFFIAADFEELAAFFLQEPEPEDPASFLESSDFLTLASAIPASSCCVTSLKDNFRLALVLSSGFISSAFGLSDSSWTGSIGKAFGIGLPQGIGLAKVS